MRARRRVRAQRSRTAAGSTPTTSSCSVRCSPTAASCSSPARSSTSPTSAGSRPPGSASLATDTFVEGLLLPPVRLLREGEPVDDVLRIIGRNSRTPDKVVGDVQALVAGVNVIARRVDELHDALRRGRRSAAVRRRDLDDSERRMRARARRAARRDATTARSPSTATASTGAHVRRARRGHAGRPTATVDVDFAGTSTQARGAINSSVSQTLSGVVYAVPLLRRPDHPDERGLLPAAARCTCRRGRW